MQKWVHPTTKTTKCSTLYGMIFNDSTKSSRHGMKVRLANEQVGDILPELSSSILQEWPLLEIGCWMESDAQLVSSEFPTGVRLGSDQETYLATESLSPLFFFRNPTVALDVCLGSLSCWKSARRPRARSDGSIFSFSIEQYICEFMMPSMKCSSPTPAALMQPHIMTLPPPCFTVGTMHFSLYSSPLRRHTVLKPSVPKSFNWSRYSRV